MSSESQGRVISKTSTGCEIRKHTRTEFSSALYDSSEIFVENHYWSDIIILGRGAFEKAMFFIISDTIDRIKKKLDPDLFIKSIRYSYR